jgi:hypothetical protein
MDWFVIWYFGKKFVEGFLIGVVIRMIFAVLLRSTPTFKGVFNTGMVIGILYTVAYYYVIATS